MEFAIAEEIEQAFKIAGEQRVEALLPLSDPMALGNAERIAALSLQTHALGFHDQRRGS